MSVWYEIKDIEDIDISLDGEELHILFDSDDTGNNYVSVPVEMVEKVLAAHKGV